MLKTGGIGDTVLLAGVIADLRLAFPLGCITLLCSHSNVAVARLLDGVDQVVEVPMVNLARGYQAVRSCSFDVLVDFGHWSRAEAILAWFSRAKVIIGFRTRGQRRHYGYDLTVEHSSEVHELENYRRLVRVLGVEPISPPSIRAPELTNELIREYGVLHLWSAGRRRELKQWSEKNWLRLAIELSGCGLNLVLTGGASDWAKNEDLLMSLPRRVRQHTENAAGRSISETCAILASARLVVSIDTGVMHMAAALRAPLVALHGPTSSRRWGPISEKAIVIDSPLPGCGYMSLGSENRRLPPRCMEAITYETVRDACLAMLRIKAS